MAWRIVISEKRCTSFPFFFFFVSFRFFFTGKRTKGKELRDYSYILRGYVVKFRSRPTLVDRKGCPSTCVTIRDGAFTSATPGVDR